MKFELRWASHRLSEDDDKTIEINTLEELKALQEQEGSQLIVNFHVPPVTSGWLAGCELPTIWIYDGYMES